MASADHVFCLLSPWMSCLEKHLLKDYAIHPLPNVGTHQGTFLCPSTVPFCGWTGPPSSLTPWWWGSSGHLSTTASTPCDFHNSIRALLSHQLKGLGDEEKFHNDITFLLVSTEEVTGDRTYGLSTVWVNPYQARVSTVEEAVREQTTLVSSGPDWPYTLVQLNKDTCHAPLPREGHLGILSEGGTNRTTCGRIRQLVVCQLLQFDLQVVYPVGLNSHVIPLITTLPGSLANGTSLTGGKSIYLGWTSHNPLQRSQTRKHHPLVNAPSSWWSALPRPLLQNQNERSAWP